MDARRQLILTATRRSRRFSDYAATLPDEFLGGMARHLAEKGSFTFYDIGCGKGNARDFRGYLADITFGEGVPAHVIESCVYVGCDLEITQPSRGNDLFFEVPAEQLSHIGAPSLTFGTFYYSFPYIEDKLQALKEIASVSDPGAVVSVCPFYLDQIVLGNICNSETRLNLKRLFPEFDFSF